MRKNKDVITCDPDLCIFCGEYVPDGRMICPNCESGVRNDEKGNTHLFTPPRVAKRQEIKK